MPDLEQQIAEWRRQMLSAGISAPALLDELESHLREDIERLIESGVDPYEAFQTASCRIGRVDALKEELGHFACHDETWVQPSDKNMKRRILFVLLWMFGYAALVFGIWCAVIVPLVYSHRHLFAAIYLDAIFQSIFFVAPLVALWLGWRGSLPGTKQKEMKDGA